MHNIACTFFYSISMKINPAIIISLLAFQFVYQSCVPVFSELQSARMVGKGRYELTPMFSTISGSGQGTTEHLQNEYGLQAIIGLSDKVDFRLRTEVITYEASDYSDWGAILGFGPKVSLIKDKMALSLPFGTALQEDFMNEWEFQPTLLLTWPVVHNKVDITLSPKYILTFCDDCQNLGAINIGFSLSTDLSKWAIRPEYGHLYDFGESGHAGQFSIGVSKVFGNGRN